MSCSSEFCQQHADARLAVQFHHLAIVHPQNDVAALQVGGLRDGTGLDASGHQWVPVDAWKNDAVTLARGDARRHAFHRSAQGG
jgi:hypothetical protein